MNASFYLKPIRQLIDRFGLVEQGDRILVGVSGGKDSTLLLIALNALSQIKPYAFTVTGFMVDHGMLGNTEAYRRFIQSMGIALLIHEEPYAERLALNNDKTPCYTCARLRKGILYRYAKTHDFNKIAYGHTKDDCVETFLMNIVTHGKLAGLPPALGASDEPIRLIRPMLYLDEDTITRAIGYLGVPLLKDQCVFAKQRIRNQMEDLVQLMEENTPGIGNQMIKALHHVDLSRTMHLKD